MVEEQLAPGFPTVPGHIPLQDLLLSALHSLHDVSVLPSPYCLTKAFPPRFTGRSTSTSTLLSPLRDAWPMEIPAPARGKPASDRNLEHTWGGRKAQARSMRMTGLPAVLIILYCQTVTHLSDSPNPGLKVQQVSACWGHSVPGSPETQSLFKVKRSW